MSKDFPVWACLEHYVLYRAMEDGSLENSARKVEAEYGLEAGYLGNGLPWQPRAISLANSPRALQDVNPISR